MNIYINMFCNTKRRKALIFNDILQQESLVFKRSESAHPCRQGSHQNPITQPLFLILDCFSTNLQCKYFSSPKNSHRGINCPFQASSDWIISMTKQKHVNTCPKTPFFYFLFSTSSYPHNNGLSLNVQIFIYISKVLRTNWNLKVVENSSTVNTSRINLISTNVQTMLNVVSFLVSTLGSFFILWLYLRLFLPFY